VTVITMSSDLFRRNEVATVAGMAGFFGNLGVLIFSLLIGGLVASVGYDPFFVALGVLDLAGAALLWTLVRDPGRLPPAPSPSPFPPCRAFHAARHDLQPDPAGLQSRPVDHPRRRGLLRRHLDLRVVPGRADPPLARPGELAAADPAPDPGQPAEHAGRPGQLRGLGPVPDPRRRQVLADLHRREALWPHHGGRGVGRVLRDFHNYLVTADDIEGPWSDPVFLNSSGFDPSLFHDDDGRKWLLNQLWDHRPGRNRFAGIVAQEYDARRQAGRRAHR
jgi:hypothetical protein